MAIKEHGSENRLEPVAPNGGETSTIEAQNEDAEVLWDIGNSTQTRDDFFRYRNRNYCIKLYVKMYINKNLNVHHGKFLTF